MMHLSSQFGEVFCVIQIHAGVWLGCFHGDIRKDNASAKGCGQRTTTRCPHPACHRSPPRSASTWQHNSSCIFISCVLRRKRLYNGCTEKLRCFYKLTRYPISLVFSCCKKCSNYSYDCPSHVPIF